MIKRNVQYMTIANNLRDQIKNQKLKSGTPVKSCREIANEYGVSIKTARSAVLELVRDDILYLEQGRGTFVKYYSGQERELNIGCAISAEIMESEGNSRKSLLSACGKDAIDYLCKHNCNIRHIPNIVVHDSKELSKYIEGLDGLLISAVDVFVDECYDIRKLNIPIVIFQSEYEHKLPVSQIVPDHYIAYRRLFELVRPEQYERIKIVHEYYRNHLSRRDILIECAMEAGFKPEQLETHSTTVADVYSLGMKLAENAGDSLIFSISSRLSPPLYNSLSDKGLIPGKSFHMIAYDDIEHDHSKAVRGLTAIDYSHHDASILAAKMLISEIRNKHEYTQIIKIPTRLIVRDSAALQ